MNDRSTDSSPPPATSDSPPAREPDPAPESAPAPAPAASPVAGPKANPGPAEVTAPPHESQGDQSRPPQAAPAEQPPGSPREDQPQPADQKQRAERKNRDGGPQQGSRKKGRGRNRGRYRDKSRRKEKDIATGPPVEAEGLLEISSKGFGFLRSPERSFQQSPKDVFVTPELVRNHGLRDGVRVKCVSRQGNRGPQLTELLEINTRDPETYKNLPYFEELTAINPTKRIVLETVPDRYTTRVIDLMTPVGRGQRGLIVAPPRTGKTTLLHHMAEAVLENHTDTLKLIILLVDERPEEVTDFQRSFPGAEIMASSNDSDVKSHTRIAQLAIERAKRLVEAGEHVFLLLDSITRLARAFNNAVKGGGKRGTQTGGLSVGALEIPRKLFAAARNTREAGSLTVIATALIQTNSRMDEAIFQEFKGTGNMELVLDRMLAQNYVYPAVDIHKSGTRREELLLPPHMLEKIHVIRRGLAGHKPLEAMEAFLKFLERFPNNNQMLLEIKASYADRF